MTDDPFFTVSNIPYSRNNRGGGPPSNVSRLSGAIARKCCSGKPQIIHYHPGVGTEATKLSRYVGGAFGVGVLQVRLHTLLIVLVAANKTGQDIVESYRFICDNYNPGDELVIIGFSRGAFTARSVANMICNLGFLNRAGLDELPHIFHDYQHWADWTSEDVYDESEYLCGFNLENYARVARFEAWRQKGKLTKNIGELNKDLEEEKRAFFGRMTKLSVESSEQGRKRMDLRKMADMYRDMLSKVWLGPSQKGRRLTLTNIARDVSNQASSKRSLHRLRSNRRDSPGRW